MDTSEKSGRGRLVDFLEKEESEGFAVHRHRLVKLGYESLIYLLHRGSRNINPEIDTKFMCGIGIALFLRLLHLLGEVALSVAVHHRLVPIDAKILDDVGLVELITSLNHRIHHAVQHEYGAEKDMKQGLDHGAKVKQDKGSSKVFLVFEKD